MKPKIRRFKNKNRSKKGGGNYFKFTKYLPWNWRRNSSKKTNQLKQNSTTKSPFISTSVIKSPIYQEPNIDMKSNNLFDEINLEQLLQLSFEEKKYIITKWLSILYKYVSESDHYMYYSRVKLLFKIYHSLLSDFSILEEDLNYVISDIYLLYFIVKGLDQTNIISQINKIFTSKKTMLYVSLEKEEEQIRYEIQCAYMISGSTDKINVRLKEMATYLLEETFVDDLKHGGYKREDFICLNPLAIEFLENFYRKNPSLPRVYGFVPIWNELTLTE